METETTATETMQMPKQSIAADSVIAYLNVIATALNQITLDLNNQIANINAAINKENDTNESAS
jgi:hypothetical protein